MKVERIGSRGRDDSAGRARPRWRASLVLIPLVIAAAAACVAPPTGPAPTTTTSSTTTTVAAPAYSAHFNCTNQQPQGCVGSGVLTGPEGTSVAVSVATRNTDGTEQTEVVDCGPTDATGTLTCSMNLVGSIYQGGAVSKTYTFADGSTVTAPPSAVVCNDPSIPAGQVC